MAGTTKGMFFNDLIELVARRCGREEAERMCRELDLGSRFSVLGDYPIEDEVRLQQAAIARLFPGQPLTEGMFALGKTAFETFANSMLGRVGLTLLANEPLKLARRLPTYIEAVDRFGQVSVEELGERKVQLHYRDFREYGEHHQGILQAGMEHTGHRGRVDLEVERFEQRGPGDVVTDFTLTLTWE